MFNVESYGGVHVVLLSLQVLQPSSAVVVSHCFLKFSTPVLRNFDLTWICGRCWTC